MQWWVLKFFPLRATWKDNFLAIEIESIVWKKVFSLLVYIIMFQCYSNLHFFNSTLVLIQPEIRI